MVLDKNIYWKILRNQLTVMGTWNSSFTQDEGDDWHYVLQRLGQKQVKPAELISHVFPSSYFTSVWTGRAGAGISDYEG